MNYSIFRLTLNMHSLRSQASVPAFRGDTAIRLVITITDGGNPYFIEDGCTAILSGTKADGTKLYNRCVIENNTTVVYDFTEQTASSVGVANCEIILYGADGNKITAPKFVIVVDDNEVGYNDVVDSENESNALDNLFKSEGDRAYAEIERCEAESARKEAEVARDEAEVLRVEAEKARVSAEHERVEAETARSSILKKGNSEGAILANDVDNNGATKNSFAGGENTFAGLRGYEIISVSQSMTDLQLDSTEGLSVGDIVSYATYDSEAKGWKPNVDNNVISRIWNQFVVLEKPAVGLLENGTKVSVESRLAYRLSVREKPWLGTYDVSTRAFSTNRDTSATGDGSFAKGRNTKARGDYSETGGRDTIADEEGSRAYGWGSHSKAWFATAEGKFTITEEGADYSEATGEGTVATAPVSKVGGRFNVRDDKKEYLEIIGNGTDHYNRSNARTLDHQGNAWYAGEVSVGNNRDVLAKSKDIQPLDKRIKFLELVNEGHTHTFETDSTTASVKAIPSKALPCAVLQKVCGKTVTAQAFNYAVPEFIPFALESITIRGKNFLNTNRYVLGSLDNNTGATNVVYYILRLAELMPIYGGKAYTVSCAKGYDLRHIYFYDADKNFISAVWMNRVQKYTVTAPTNAAYFNMCFEPTGISSSTKLTDAEVETIRNECKAQVEYGETEYTPYREPITYTIPQEIKNLVGYGHGISNTVCNYIDFENKQYVRMCAERDFKEEDRDNPSVIYNHIETLTIAPLNEPFVTDISEHLTFDNTFEVQGGGFIEFDFSAIGEIYGDYEELNPSIVQAPSTITYQVKL